MSFLDSLGKTFKSLGGALAAPVTTVYDLGHVAWDDTSYLIGHPMSSTSRSHDNIEDYVHVLSHGVSNVLDPLSNPDTWTGYAVGHVMHGLDVAFQHAEHPVSTFMTAGQHSLTTGVNPSEGTLSPELSKKYGRPIYVLGQARESHPGELLDPETWRKAWQISRGQSIGQSTVFSGTGADPFRYGGRTVTEKVKGPDGKVHAVTRPLTPYEAALQAGKLGTADVIGSNIEELVATWFLDPGVLAGKLAKVGMAAQLGKLTQAKRATLGDQLFHGPDPVTGLRRFVPHGRSMQTRSDQFNAYILGDNPLKKPLTGPEIYHSSPELKMSAQGRDIADLMAQAVKMDAPLDDKVNALRRITAVAGGDPTQIMRLQEEIPQAKAIADALSNISNRSVAQATLQELNADARYSPELLGDMQRQLDNLDAEGDVTKFVNDWMGKKESEAAKLLDVSGQMNHLPGAHGTAAPLRYIPGPQGASDKALLRQHGLNGLNRIAKLGPAAERIAKDRVNGSSTLWQKSLNQVPLLVARVGDAFTAPYLKMPAAADNALRQTHYIGVANLHDWAGATDQLDSMLRLMGANDAERLGALDKAFSARSELDKRTAIRHVEKVAMRAFAAKMTAKFGHHIDQDYIENLLSKGHYDTDRLMNSLQGVAYSATSMPEDMLLRQRGFQNLADQSNALGKIVEPRVDQFLDENHVPVSLPIFETQLANKVPLLDAHLITKAFQQQEKVKQLSDISRAWKDEALDLKGLAARWQKAKGGEKDVLAKLLRGKYATMDALTSAGQLLTRAWKYSVLLRLGYPQRVLMDDNARIMSQLGLSHFLDNGAEATRAWWHNRAPGAINGNGRKAFAARRYAEARMERQTLQQEYGYDKPHSDEDFDKITEAARTLTKRKATATDKGMAQATLDKLDPEGHISSHYILVSEIGSLRRSNTSLERNITKMQAELDGGLEGEAASELRRKIALARHQIADNSAGIEFKQGQLKDRSPDEIRKALRGINDLLIAGPKMFRENKRTLGQAEVNLDLPGVDPVTGKPWAAYGAFAGPGEAYKGAASSQETFSQVISDGEERAYNAAKTGLWRTVANTEHGHIHAWADVINHQLRNSAIGMWHARHPNGTLEEFETWLADPARRHLSERLPHLARDPEGWYHRTKAMVDDVLSHDEVRQAAVDGRVSVNQLRKAVPTATDRPAIHGAALDFNTGRNAAARMTGDALNNMMRWLSETPTDKLSRQPFFNSIYKREVREMARLRYDAAAKMGRQFGDEDLRFIERQARKKALNAVKSYLWDISAHSNAAHMLRFVSPFFAAHQEALNRWWRIAKEDPSVVRRFQLAFDAPRKMGLVYDSETGEPIKPGESISSNHRVLLRVPWVGDDSGVNRWLRKLGGDRYWSINENGLNTLLQGGLTNPGTGPMVSLPAGVFAHKYADDPEILKAANILTSGYIPDTPADAILPAWAAKAKALATKDGRYDQQFTANMQDRLAAFLKANGRTPTDAELDSIMRMAGQKTNRDLVMMGLSNLTMLTPAKPNSQYAAIQDGFARLRKQADAEGRDSQWLFDQFDKKYGSIYDVLIASSSANPAKLTGSPAEVAAVKKYKSLLAKVDPLVARTVIGPEAAKGGPAATAYNPISRQSLESMRLTPGSNDTLIESKDPRQIALGALEDQGWDQYDQLTNWLTVTAKQAGLKSYYDSPQLMALKSAGLKNILANNFAFRNAWVQASTGDQYDKYLDDLREVAKSKALNDTSRPDIAYLKQYLQVRDWVTENLKARKAAGGSDSPDSSENSALMQFFTNYTLSLADKSTYFQSFIFNGLVERDPYLLATQLAVTK